MGIGMIDRGTFAFSIQKTCRVLIVLDSFKVKASVAVFLYFFAEYFVSSGAGRRCGFMTPIDNVRLWDHAAEVDSVLVKKP